MDVFAKMKAAAAAGSTPAQANTTTTVTTNGTGAGGPRKRARNGSVAGKEAVGPWVYRQGVFDANESAALFEEIRALVLKSVADHGQPKVKIGGELRPQNRVVAYFSRTTSDYVYSGARPPNAGWPPVMQRLATIASTLVSQTLASDQRRVSQRGDKTATATPHHSMTPTAAVKAKRPEAPSATPSPPTATVAAKRPELALATPETERPKAAPATPSPPTAAVDTKRPEAAISAALGTGGAVASAASGAVGSMVVGTANVEPALAGEEGVGAVFDSALCNYYRDGSDTIGRHNDKEALDGWIVSFSFYPTGGKERDFVIYLMHGPRVAQFSLANGSVLLMRPGMQRTHEHSVPKRSNHNTPRINATLRQHPDRRVPKAGAEKRSLGNPLSPRPASVQA